MRPVLARSAMLRTRLFLNLLPFVVILLAVGVYAIALFSRLAYSVDTTVTENYRSIIASQSMSLALAGMEREVWVTAGGRNPDSKVFANHQKRFEENLALQLKNNALPAENELNEQLKNTYGAFHAAVARLRSASEEAAQHRVYEQEILPAVLRLNVLLDKIRDLNQVA